VTKRRTIFLSTLLLLATAALGFYFVIRPHEPTYEGRTCRDWLLLAYRNHDREIDAHQAIQELGTNAIPTLLEMLRAETDTSQVMDWNENLLVERAFAWLGADATNAIPDLIAMYRPNNSPMRQKEALSVLSRITQTRQSTALMQEALTNSRAALREIAYVHFADRDKAAAIPLLITALSDRSENIQAMAAYRLQQFGTNAIAAVPALLPLAATITNKNENGYSDNFAAAALRTIDPETAAKVLPPKFIPPAPSFLPSGAPNLHPGMRHRFIPVAPVPIRTNK
jgi:hypothetical protein